MIASVPVSSRALPGMFRRVPAPIASSRTMAIGAHIGANVIWAGSAVASKPLLQDLPPITTATIRVAIALAVLRLVLAPTHERPASGSAPALLGLVGVAFFCALHNLGLLFADATMTSMLTGCIPVLTLGLAVPLLHERLDGLRLAGVIISTVGVGLIVVIGSAQPPGMAILAGILPLSSALASALYMVLGRRVFAGGSPLALVTGSTRYGLMFLLAGAVVELMVVDLGRITPHAVLILAYLGAGSSALAPVLRGYGLKHLGASHGAVYGNLRPLVGVGLAMCLLGEPLTIVHIAGGALILSGVGITSRRSPIRFPRRHAQFLPRGLHGRAGIG